MRHWSHELHAVDKVCHTCKVRPTQMLQQYESSQSEDTPVSTLVSDLH